MKDEIKNGMIGVEEIWNGGWENKTKKKLNWLVENFLK